MSRVSIHLRVSDQLFVDVLRFGEIVLVVVPSLCNISTHPRFLACEFQAPVGAYLGHYGMCTEGAGHV